MLKTYRANSSSFFFHFNLGKEWKVPFQVRFLTFGIMWQRKAS